MVVVGLGQVGLRLCLSLRELGVPVSWRSSPTPRATTSPAPSQYRVPVVVGQGGGRFLLGRLSLERARALAAVTSDEIANIAIVVVRSACARISARSAARRAWRRGQRDALTVQHRGRARCAPRRRDHAGGRRGRRGERGVPARADRVPDRAGRANPGPSRAM
ncbi:MAG: NAD-binding protein [Thermoleophilaceae bacterium]